MKKLLILSLLIFTGCATRFIKMEPELSGYSHQNEISKNVTIKYGFDAMSKSRNTIYDYKEDRKNLQLLSVRISNESKDTLVFTKENLNIKTLLGTPINILNDEEFYVDKIKQRAGWYMLYSLFGFMVGWTSDNDRYRITVNPIGALIGVYNLALGVHGNMRLKKSMKKYNLFNQRIAPNTTFDGFIILGENIEEQKLNFKYK